MQWGTNWSYCEVCLSINMSFVFCHCFWGDSSCSVFKSDWECASYCRIHWRNHQKWTRLCHKRRWIFMNWRLVFLLWNDGCIPSQCLTQHLCNTLVAGDVYFDIQSIGDRYGKFAGAVDSQGEPGKCVPLSQWGNSFYDYPSLLHLSNCLCCLSEFCLSFSIPLKVLKCSF